MNEQRRVVPAESFGPVLEELLTQAKTAVNGAEALRYAQAVNEIAEAYAWTRSVGQPHGGHTRTD